MRTIFLLICIAFSAPHAFSQNSCYQDLLSEGNKHLKANRYEKAIQQYEAAKLCGDKPANGDGVLKNKIALAKQQQKEAQLEKEEAAERVRLKQAEEARKIEEQNQLAEFAWQKLQGKPSPLQYYYFSQKYPLSKRSEEAKQKIAEIQTQFNPENCNYCPEMVMVKGGSFIPGDMEKHLASGKLPPAIQVDDFSIGKFEVSMPEFCQFLNEEIGAPKWANSDSLEFHIEAIHPHWGNFETVLQSITYKNGKYSPAPGWESGPAFIYEIFWSSSMDHPESLFLMYADWLSVKTGRNYRLPYNEEWEYAAKGGIKSQNFRFAGSNEISEVADVSRLNLRGQRKPNELGIYDMSGNVGEFTMISPGNIRSSWGDETIRNIYGARLVLCKGDGGCGVSLQKK